MALLSTTTSGFIGRGSFPLINSLNLNSFPFFEHKSDSMACFQRTLNCVVSLVLIGLRTTLFDNKFVYKNIKLVILFHLFFVNFFVSLTNLM